ncbi:MAG TPA: D-Ala-D-Ala carboxypeptidase family metallohydrolase [Gemmatimonadaceae bacterium]|nr:D-Ala-D-Ala carboxypeptidase family metallohydrolase [Gemmatimonadaceae bacterium]
MTPKRRRFKPVIRRHPLLRADVATVMVALCAAIGVIQFYRPDSSLGRAPFARFGGTKFTLGSASGNAFGRSGEVKLLFSLPGRRIEYPLAIGGDPAVLTYEWTSLRGAETGFSRQPIEGAEVTTPSVPGFYYLTLIRGEERQVLQEPVVAVMRPFREKLGAMLNGYRIGMYLAERLRGDGEQDHPDGFLEIYPQYLDLAVSTHLKLKHFLTHDDQANVWPKYVALNPRLLDKLELVFAELETMRGSAQADTDELELDVHSGFRTPSHNRQVQRAARDSRHQYGDAADVVVDANGNGRIDGGDQRLIVAAVEEVERTHPDLVGGLGIYNSRNYTTPYVHIDARGRRSRWRG